MAVDHIWEQRPNKDMYHCKCGAEITGLEFDKQPETAKARKAFDTDASEFLRDFNWDDTFIEAWFESQKEQPNGS